MNPRHALITGAAGAIGGALAQALHRAFPSLHLSLSDRDQDGLSLIQSRLGERASTHLCDLTQRETLEGLVREAEGEQGPPDVLVNCAGIMDVRTLGAMPWEAGERVLEVDFMSPMRLMSLVVPGMVERRMGCVINVSSMAGITPIRGCAYYGGAKAGLAMASEIAALELAEHDVQVITVYPGPVESGLEAGARAQLPETLMTRVIPTGKPEALAQRIVEAMHKGKTRVVYPLAYDVASRVPGFASQLTRWLSPRPLE